MKHKDSIIIYSDGACSGNPGPGGWACVVIDNSSQIVEELAEHSAQTTNNRMEITASMRALQLVLDRSLQLGTSSNTGKLKQPNHIKIYTDSVYVIRGITQWVFGWKKRGWKNAENEPVSNQDLWEELDRIVYKTTNLPHKPKLSWHYVRGHAGDPGNERCDQLAVKASKRERFTLYQGPSDQYHFDVNILPKDQPLPESNWNKSDSTKKTVAYLSYVNGKLKTHTTWSECEAEVKGRPGAKFKKYSTEEEAAEIKKAWGLS